MAADQYHNTEEIALFLQGETSSLSAKQRELYERMDYADNLLRKYGPGKKTRKMIMKKFKVSDPTAWRICKAAENVFGSTARVNKEYYKEIAIETLIQAKEKLLEQLFGTDEDPVDGSPDPKLFKALSDIMAELRRTIKYDEQDPDLPVWSELGPNLIEVVFDPALVGGEPIEDLDAVVERLTKSKRISSIERDAIDVDHEEI